MGPPQRPPAVDEPPLPPLGPDPLSPTALDLVPEREPADEPTTGETFGGEGNGFADGYRRFALPEGTRLVAAQGGGRGHSVLASDDVQETMDALVTQADGPGLDLAPERETPTVDGRVAARRSWGISGGGGGCTLLADPDGTHVLVSMYSD